MAGVFVVDLPGVDVVVAAIAFAKDAGDAAGFVAVALVGETIVAAGAEGADVAIGVAGEHVGVFVNHPTGGRGGGGAEDDFEARVSQRVDGAV